MEKIEVMNITTILGRMICWLGFHDWIYSEDKQYRCCRHSWCTAEQRRKYAQMLLDPDGWHSL